MPYVFFRVRLTPKAKREKKVAAAAERILYNFLPATCAGVLIRAVSRLFNTRPKIVMECVLFGLCRGCFIQQRLYFYPFTFCPYNKY